MPAWAIRRAGPEDAASIASLILPVFRAGDTYTVDPGITEPEALAYWCAPDKTVFLAEDAVGEALGTYYIRPNAGGGAPMSAIADTSPVTRRGGVAWRAPCWPTRWRRRDGRAIARCSSISS
jgi:hypothetical protein